MEQCSVTDCSLVAVCLNLCGKHYQRFRRTGSTERFGNRGASSEQACATCGKTFKVQANQIVRGEGKYCSYPCKYEATRGVERVTGTRFVRKDGYVTIKVGVRRRELEHRVVMEELLGRKLETDEQIHHVNGERADNRPENLVVMTNADHQRFHDHLDVMHIPRTVTLICQWCGKSYTNKPSRAETSKFCSNPCRLVALHEGRRKK